VATVSLSGTTAGAGGQSASLSRIRGLSGNAGGQSNLPPPILLRTWNPILSLPQPDSELRELDWNTGETVKVAFDGRLYDTITGGPVEVDASETIRQYIDISDEMPATTQSPFDKVELTWDAVSDADYYEVEKSTDGGSTWSTVETTSDTSYTTDALTDDTYDYRVGAINDDGLETESTTVQLTVSSAPEPPSNLSYSIS